MSIKDRLQQGKPWPLGAHYDGKGVNFALFSAHAEAVTLCLFENGVERTLPLAACTDQVWHGYLAGLAPGAQYAFRVNGGNAPGLRFAPERLLLDPYARELSGTFSYGDQQAPEHGLRCCVVGEAFDWKNDAPPDVPWTESILYEVHVKGATRLQPELPEALRGTYAGLTAPPMLKHFKRLGITAVNLLPVQAFLDEERLVNSGLRNYWGYNTLAFFAPESRYAARTGGLSVIAEFKTMVRDLHRAGIEVILDVVYNHTAETDAAGPTVSFRGIDNPSYYRLQDDAPEHYENYSGCGNTFNVAHPRTLQLVMDSLRYWVGEMHVDGFRFDLAAALTRDSSFLAAVRQDPLLARVKMIAEPWDLGPDGYRLGRFPPGWSEWNDRFRDDVRAFWLTGDVGGAALAQRLAGSSEIFRHAGRAPQAGINFITAHDGYTLRDLVSYQHKHNEQNGEANRDGHDHNLSWNCGAEGETRDTAVLYRRHCLQRALLATLLLAQGVPMLQGGDEMGRTQLGNNNAYCQDNALTWLSWNDPEQEALIDYTAGLIALRARFPQLRRSGWLTGNTDDHGRRDIRWWHVDGREMADGDWHSAERGALGLLLGASTVPHGKGASGPLLVLINRDAGTLSFRLPPGRWRQLCDSAATTPFAADHVEASTALCGHSLKIFTLES